MKNVIFLALLISIACISKMNIKKSNLSSRDPQVDVDDEQEYIFRLRENGDVFTTKYLTVKFHKEATVYDLKKEVAKVLHNVKAEDIEIELSERDDFVLSEDNVLIADLELEKSKNDKDEIGENEINVIHN